MATTLRTFISRLVRESRADETHVHFHQGPQGQPAACHDWTCSSPRLEL